MRRPTRLPVGNANRDGSGRTHSKSGASVRGTWDKTPVLLLQIWLAADCSDPEPFRNIAPGSAHRSRPRWAPGEAQTARERLLQPCRSTAYHPWITAHPEVGQSEPYWAGIFRVEDDPTGGPEQPTGKRFIRTWLLNLP